MENWNAPAEDWSGSDWKDRAVESIRFLTIHGVLSPRERDKALERLRNQLRKQLRKGALKREPVA